MKLSSILSKAGAFACTAIALVGLTGTATAQCIGYTTTVNPAGAAFEPGTADVGNHADDLVTSGIALPFPVTFYAATFNAVNVSSNGNLQFSTAVNAWTNANLPSTTFAGPVICGLWDDLRTDGAGQGIFTSTSGAPGSQRFNIEWRHGFFSGFTGTGNWAISFYEGQSFFDVFYVAIPSGGQSATIGVQSAGASGSPATVFSFNPAAPGSLVGVSAIRYNCTPATQPTNPTCNVAVNPGTVSNGGTGSTLVTCNVTPGINPSTAPHTVNADLTSIGGGAINAMVEGPANVWTLNATVAAGTPAGTYGIVCTVREVAAPNRSSTCTANVTVGTGACCVAGACSAGVTEFDCTTQGGTFQGLGTACSGCSCVTSSPANDACSAATSVAIPSSTVGSTCGGTVDSAPVCGGNTPTAPGVWYSLVGTGNTITVSTCNAVRNYDTRISVFCAAGGCDSLLCIGQNDDGGGTCGLGSSFSFCSQPGAPYLVLVHGFVATSSGSFQLDVSDDATPCATPIGCIPTGACCMTSSCSIMSEADCATAGGRWLGVNTECATTTISHTNTYTSTPGLAIPDSPGGPVSDILNVPDSFSFTDVSVRVNIPDHTFIGDLVVTLSKGATSVVVWNRQCGGNDGMTVTFSDAGVAVVCLSPTAGEYLPANALNFAGETSDGDWTLTVQDFAGIDVGTLADWTLLFNRTVTTQSNCSCHGECVADFDDGSGTGTPDQGVTIDDLLYYLGIFEAGVLCADVDDGSGTGTPDQGVTIDDLLYYLQRFEEGC